MSKRSSCSSSTEWLTKKCFGTKLTLMDIDLLLSTPSAVADHVDDDDACAWNCALMRLNSWRSVLLALDDRCGAPGSVLWISLCWAWSFRLDLLTDRLLVLRLMLARNAGARNACSTDASRMASWRVYPIFLKQWMSSADSLLYSRTSDSNSIALADVQCLPRNQLVLLCHGPVYLDI